MKYDLSEFKDILDKYNYELATLTSNIAFLLAVHVDDSNDDYLNSDKFKELSEELIVRVSSLFLVRREVVALVCNSNDYTKYTISKDNRFVEEKCV